MIKLFAIMKHNFSALKDSLRKFDSKLLHSLIVAGLLFLGSASMSAQNKVLNPGFEDSNTTAPVWSIGGGSITTSDFYTGLKCAILSNTDGGYCTKTVTGLKGGTTYILTAMFKASVGTVFINVKNYKVTDASDIISVPTTSTTWTSTGNIIFKTGTYITQATIWLSTDPGNTGYADDFSVVEATAESPAIVPTTPTNLTAKDILPTSFLLSWIASTDNTGIASYEVFKDGVSIGSTPNGVQTSMFVTGVTAGGNYSMTVRAKDVFGNVSTLSDPIAVATGTSTTSNNIVLNPDFEYPGSSAWVLGANTTVVSYNPAISGTRCVKLGGGASAVQTVTGLTENTNYVFTAQCKANTAANITVGVKNYLTATTGDNNITSTNTSWSSTGNLYFTTGSGITSVKVSAITPTQSNPVYADAFSITFVSFTTGINNTSLKSNVYSSKSNIIFEGLATQKADIYSVSGKLVKSVLIKSNLETIDFTKGFYIVKVGSDNYKLLIQ